MKIPRQKANYEKLRIGLFGRTSQVSLAPGPRQARVGSPGMLVELEKLLTSWFPHGAVKSTLPWKSIMPLSPACH